MKDLIQNARAVVAQLRGCETMLTEEAADTIAALCSALEQNESGPLGRKAYEELSYKLQDERNAEARECDKLRTALEAAQKQMESQKNEWLKWEAKRTALEVDAARWKEVEYATDLTPYLREYHSGVCLSVETIDATIAAQGEKP